MIRARRSPQYTGIPERPTRAFVGGKSKNPPPPDRAKSKNALPLRPPGSLPVPGVLPASLLLGVGFCPFFLGSLGGAAVFRFFVCFVLVLFAVVWPFLPLLVRAARRRLFVWWVLSGSPLFWSLVLPPLFAFVRWFAFVLFRRVWLRPLFARWFAFGGPRPFASSSPVRVVVASGRVVAVVFLGRWLFRCRSFWLVGG